LLVMSAGCKSAIEKQTIESEFIVNLSCKLNHCISQVCQNWKVEFVINQVVSQKGKIKSG